MPSEIVRVIEEGKRELSDRESAARSRLQSRYRQTMDLLESELNLVLRQIDAMDAGTLLTNAGRYTRRGRQWRALHLQGLIQRIEQEYARNASLGAQDIAALEADAVSLAQQTAANTGITAGPGPAVNVRAVERLSAATRAGSPVYALLEDYGPLVAQEVEEELTQGVLRGHGADKIRRSIRQRIGPNGIPDWKIAQITRTESMRAFRGGLNDSYRAMGVQQVRWVAALQTRTCAACLAMHGTLHPIDYEMASHPQCRCVLIPVSGDDYNEPTGEEWLRGLPPDKQRAVFPTEGHYEAWKDGMSLSDMTGTRHSRTWGDSVTVKSLRDLGGGGSPVPFRASGAYMSMDSTEDVTAYLNKLGVENVDLSGGTKTMNNVIGEGMHNMSARGIPMPKDVRIAKLGKDGPIGYMNAGDASGRLGAPGGITLNRDHPYWRAPGKVARQQKSQRFLASGDPLQAVYHEHGHHLHYQNAKRTIDLGDGQVETYVVGNLFDTNEFYDYSVKRLVSYEVSHYAATSPVEMVAEVFSGLMTGETYPEAIMDLYRQYGGYIP